MIYDDEDITTMQRETLAEVMTDSHLLFYENVGIVVAAYKSYATVVTRLNLKLVACHTCCEKFAKLSFIEPSPENKRSIPCRKTPSRRFL